MPRLAECLVKGSFDHLVATIANGLIVTPITSLAYQRLCGLVVVQTVKDLVAQSLVTFETVETARMEKVSHRLDSRILTHDLCLASAARTSVQRRKRPLSQGII